MSCGRLGGHTCLGLVVTLLRGQWSRSVTCGSPIQVSVWPSFGGDSSGSRQTMPAGEIGLHGSPTRGRTRADTVSSVRTTGGHPAANEGKRREIRAKFSAKLSELAL